nr:NS3 [Phasianus chaphamaparvovirus]
MAAYGASTGFTLLVWIDPESWRLTNMDEEQRRATEKELLEDACTLLCGRWGMDSTIVDDSGDTYAFFSCPRFVVSSATLLRALGSLGDSVKFHRGAAGDNHKLLIRYRKCLSKYNVQDKVSEGSYSEGFEGNQSGPSWSANKRPRTK